MRLQWPKQVPPGSRIQLGAGPKCFAIERRGGDRWRRQRIRLTSNLLVLVSRGSVVIERCEQRLSVDEGGSALVLPGEFRLTEIPDRVGRAASRIVFFNDRTIAAGLARLGNAETLATAVAPAFHGLYPLNNRWTQQHSVGLVFPAGFPAGFNQLVNTVSSAVFMFLRDSFFNRARALDLWMETQVLTGVDALQLPQIYPAGARRFYSDWKTYERISPGAWLRRRKMELASVWIRHGDAELERIRQSLGYVCQEKFTAEYAAKHGIAPESEKRAGDGRQLAGPVLRQKLRPFWHVDETEARRKLVLPRDRNELNASFGGPATPEYLPPENDREPQSELHAIETDISSFWDLKITAMPQLLAA